MSSTSTKLLAVIVLLLTFVVGGVVGVFVDHVFLMRLGPPQHSPEFLVRRLDRRLNLTEQQRAQVVEIVQRHHQRMRGVWMGVQPAMRNEIDQANNEIERILTPEQRVKFRNIRMRLMPRGPIPAGPHGMRVPHD